MEYNVQHWADTRSIERISCVITNVCDSVGSVHRGRGSTDSVSMVCDSVGSVHRGRGGKDTSSSRHPDFSRSMSSDNWREAKKRDVDTDAGGSWRSRQDHTLSLIHI